MINELLLKLLSAHDLPEQPPVDPMPLLMAWFKEAQESGKYEDPNAMCLATASPDGAPSVRMVLCKSIDPVRGTLTFFTNYQSRKGQELAANPRASGVFHWTHAKRQARVEGTVERTSEAESDEYFRTRSLLSRIGASVSRQSAPIESRAELIAAAMSLAKSAAVGGDIPRPANWGGFRLTIHTLELWSAQDGRLHQRIQWRRQLDQGPGAWQPRFLSP